VPHKETAESNDKTSKEEVIPEADDDKLYTKSSIS
jgi:hypothetical protein